MKSKVTCIDSGRFKQDLADEKGLHLVEMRPELDYFPRCHHFFSVGWTVQRAVLRIRDVYPGSEFFPFRIQGQEDSRIRVRIKEYKYFNPKNVYKLSEI
jgi:hypothetical protein